MLQQFKSINELADYLGTLLAELRKYAHHSTKELKSPVLQFMQVEEYLAKYIMKILRTTKQLPEEPVSNIEHTFIRDLAKCKGIATFEIMVKYIINMEIIIYHVSDGTQRKKISR